MPIGTGAAILGSALIGGGLSYLSSQNGGDDQTTTSSRTVAPYAETGLQGMWKKYMGMESPASVAKYESGSDKQKIYDTYNMLRGSGADARDYPDLAKFLYAHPELTMTWESLDPSQFVEILNADTSLTGGTAVIPNKSLETMKAEDWAAKEKAANEYLTGAGEATKPYTELLDQYVRQGNAGQGLFTPINIGIDGNKLTSFVPRANRALADQLAGFSGQSAGVKTGLLQDERNAAMTYTPNAAKVNYADELWNKMAPFILGQPTTTTTTSSGGNGWADALAGALAGATAGSKIASATGKTGNNDVSQAIIDNILSSELRY